MGQGRADPAEESRRIRIAGGARLDGCDPAPPENPMFTFWDYKRDRWRRDAGLRLDHLLVSPVLAPRLKRAGIDRLTRGEEGASDHAPAWIELK